MQWRLDLRYAKGGGGHKTNESGPPGSQRWGFGKKHNGSSGMAQRKMAHAWKRLLHAARHVIHIEYSAHYWDMSFLQ